MTAPSKRVSYGKRKSYWVSVNGESCREIGFASSNISRIISWEVGDIYTHNDHGAILMKG